jgi:hypothetical protein
LGAEEPSFSSRNFQLKREKIMSDVHDSEAHKEPEETEVKEEAKVEDHAEDTIVHEDEVEETEEEEAED